jgi:hypothetical protein
MQTKHGGIAGRVGSLAKSSPGEETRKNERRTRLWNVARAIVTAPRPDSIAQPHPRTAGSMRAIALGVLCGIVWATGFRAYMAAIAGPLSQFQWWGTFGAIIAPAALTGGILGWAEWVRERGGRPGWRWSALAPLSLAVTPLLTPGAVQDLLIEGLGGGAIGVAVIAIAGGYSVSGRGPLVARLLCGLLVALLLAGVVASVPLIGGPRLSLSEPRGAWMALLAASFTVALVRAASIPFRETRQPD